MSDNAKLKELAEALKRAIEQAEHKPGEWAGTAQSMGGICCPGVPFQIGKPWAKEEPWASFSYKRDSWLAVAAVNALPRLLGLIADNEWLTKAVGLQVIRRFVGDDDQKNIDELVAAGIQVDKELIVQLKAENERLAAACERAEQIIIVECKAASLAKVRANLLEANRDQLRAEVAGLKTGYEAYEQVVQGLKAENEALRDDLEQNQYDANAWRNREESVWIEVFHSDGDDPFISAITGQITIEQLALIQAEILEYREDYFEKGSGLYVFKCAHYQAHYDNVGMTEPAHWETDFESYSPFPWEDEAAAMSQGEQS